MENNLILQKLERIESILFENTKPMMTVEDLINYTGFKRSYIYKLVHYEEIPYSKPNGGTLFFEREEINQWLRQNKSKSISQIEQEAHNYVNSKK